MVIMHRKNMPNGFPDILFNINMLDRFLQANYVHHPYPIEELPMFYYATGYRLV